MSSKVVTVAPDTKIRELWGLIFAKHVNAVPVVDSKQKLVGILTKEDILELLYPDYQEYFADLTSVLDFEEMEGKVKELGDKRARDVMGKRIIYTREDTPVMRVLSRMIVHRVNQVPVLSKSDRVIGMITKGDIFYALFRKNLLPKGLKKHR